MNVVNTLTVPLMAGSESVTKKDAATQTATGLTQLGKGSAKIIWQHPSNPGEVIYFPKNGKQGELCEEIKTAQKIRELAQTPTHLAVDYRSLSDAELPERLRNRHDITIVAVPKATADLEKTLQEPLTLPTRIRLCYEATQALQELHQAGATHGDLKPENFLVYKNEDGSPTLKLSDFGKTTFSTSQKPSLYSGNRHFIAPEGILSHQSETFSLGLICVRILEEACLNQTDTTLIAHENNALYSTQRGVIQHLSAVTAGAGTDTSNTLLAKLKRALTRFGNFLAMRLTGKPMTQELQAQKIAALTMYINSLCLRLKAKHPEMSNQIDAITVVLESMTSLNPSSRMTDGEAVRALGKIVDSLSGLPEVDEFHDCEEGDLTTLIKQESTPLELSDCEESDLTTLIEPESTLEFYECEDGSVQPPPSV